MNLKLIAILLFLLFFFSCKKDNTQEVQINKGILTKENTEPKYGKIFFDYDQIDYYSIEIDEDKIQELDESKNKSKVDRYKYTVLVEDTPETIRDLDFLHYMKKIGFQKKEINKSKFTQMNKIFVEKTFNDGVNYACIPFFRDILIFKKQGKVIGIAKICFDCHQFRIIGTEANTDNFGMDDDYEKLGNILNNL